MNRAATPFEKAQGFTYIFNSNHLRPGVSKAMANVIERSVLMIGRSCHLPPEKGGFANDGGTMKTEFLIKRWVKPEFRDFFIEFVNRVCEPDGNY